MLTIALISNFVAFHDVHPSIDKLKHTCIYYLVKEGRRCLRAQSGQDVQAAIKLQRDLLENASNPSLEDLRNFALLNCCKKDHRTKIEDFGLLDPLIKRWAKELRDHPQQETTTPELVQSSHPSVVTARQESVPPVLLAPSPVHHRYNLRSTTKSPSQLFSPECLPVISQGTGFKPHIVPPSRTVATTLLKVLTKQDHQSGSFYLFTRSSSPGHFKIGITKQAVQTRLNQWARTCGYTPRLVTSFENVPHVYRVETLVHFELAQHWRTELRCAGCPRQHQEWFEVEESIAVEVARKYVKWIQEAVPYDDNGNLTTVWQEEVCRAEAKHGRVTVDELLRIHCRLQMESKHEEESECELVTQETSIARLSTIQAQIDQIKNIADAILALSAEQRRCLVQVLQPGSVVTASPVLEPLPSISSANFGSRLVRRETHTSLVAQA